MDQISICESLLKWNEIEPFLKQLIMCDENGSHTIIMYKKDRGQSKVKLRKARIDTKKSDAVCVVGLEKNRSLRAAAAQSND